jgi:hypothetical protein
MTISAIIFLHRISDNRMTASLLQSLRAVANFCGQQAVPFIFASTMWGEVAYEVAEEREQELRQTFVTEKLIGGHRIERFNWTWDSAWQVIDGRTLKQSGEDFIILCVSPLSRMKEI